MRAKVSDWLSLKTTVFDWLKHKLLKTTALFKIKLNIKKINNRIKRFLKLVIRYLYFYTVRKGLHRVAIHISGRVQNLLQNSWHRGDSMSQSFLKECRP